MLLGLILLNLATTPALADSSARCGQVGQGCAVMVEAMKKPRAEPSRMGPKVGQVPQSARVLKTGEARRLGKPAAGRACRVVDDRVVLVDAKTMKIVQVLGPASEILR